MKRFVPITVNVLAVAFFGTGAAFFVDKIAAGDSNAVGNAAAAAVMVTMTARSVWDMVRLTRVLRRTW